MQRKLDWRLVVVVLLACLLAVAGLLALLAGQASAGDSYHADIGINDGFMAEIGCVDGEMPYYQPENDSVVGRLVGYRFECLADTEAMTDTVGMMGGYALDFRIVMIDGDSVTVQCQTALTIPELIRGHALEFDDGSVIVGYRVNCGSRVLLPQVTR